MASAATKARNNENNRLGIDSVARFLQGISRTVWLSIFGPTLLLVFGYLAWIQYGATHLNVALYGVAEENIVVTSPPAWIRTDVKKEVFTGSRLDRLSVLDKQMSASVYNAFRVHPWIRKVFRVQKMSGGQVRVDLEYREPIAMVYYEPSLSASVSTFPTSNNPHVLGEGTSAEFLPVDVEGYLLPTKDFSSEDVTKYIRIYARNVSEAGLVGSEYGNPQIREALLLARLVKNLREPLGIDSIYVYPGGQSLGNTRSILEITTSEKQRITWGHAPGQESRGEPDMETKLRTLHQFLSNPTSQQRQTKEFDLTVVSSTNQ